MKLLKLMVLTLTAITIATSVACAGERGTLAPSTTQTPPTLNSQTPVAEQRSTPNPEATLQATPRVTPTADVPISTSSFELSDGRSMTISHAEVIDRFPSNCGSFGINCTEALPGYQLVSVFIEFVEPPEGPDANPNSPLFAMIGGELGPENPRMIGDDGEESSLVSSALGIIDSVPAVRLIFTTSAGLTSFNLTWGDNDPVEVDLLNPAFATPTPDLSPTPTPRRAPISTGTFVRTAPMNERRGNMSAVLLNDGTVLVAGGHSDVFSDGLSSAEIYDPSTDLWSLTGSMIQGRRDHAAVLLQDGRVLVVGGRSDYAGSLATAEVYDPTAGVWSATGGMAESRILHTLTLLADGRVLAAGGTNALVTASPTSVSTVEVYDPSVGTWSQAARMNDPRAAHSSSLLPDGKVLVISGSQRVVTTDFPSGDVPSSEVYDPASDTWSLTSSMAEPRANHSAVSLLNGKVLVAGGRDFRRPISSAELYDPATDQWSEAERMSETMLGQAEVLLSGGRALVVGRASAELYDPSTGSWSGLISMTRERGGHALVAISDGRALVIGGQISNHPGLDSAEVFYPGD